MINKITCIVIIGIALISCSQSETKNRALHFEMDNLEECTSDSLKYTETIYIPIYTDVYHIDQSKLFPLTVTLSLRNTSLSDSVYVLKADYYNSKGHLIKEHIADQLMLALGPLESYDLVIDKMTYKGDTGANYIVKYGQKNGESNMIVQALMINTSGQQGLSFITEGIVIDQNTTEY